MNRILKLLTRRLKNYKWILFCLCFLNNSFGQKKIGIQISPKLGFSRSQTSWAISGNLDGMSPNVMSELLWSNSSISSGFESEFSWKRFVFKTDVSRSYSADGLVSDSDYTLDNRQGLSYNESFNSKGSKFSSFKIESEYELFDNRFYLTVGYHYMRSENKLIHQDLKYSMYKWNLEGPTLGAKYMFNFSDNLSNYSGVDVLFSKYYAIANWILREDLQHPISFTHNLNRGYGLNFSNYLKINIYDKFFIGWKSNFIIYSRADGLDTAYLKSGSSFTTKLYYLRLNSIDNHISFLFDLQ